MAWHVGQQVSRERVKAMSEKARAGSDVLDVGGGRGEIALWIKEHRKCRIVVADISHFGPSECFKRGIVAVTSDCRSLPFPDGVFDVVMSGELLEHIDDPADLVREMARVCKPGGWVSLSTPNETAYNRDKQHVWAFAEGDVLGLLAPYGEASTRIEGQWIIGHCKRGS